MEGRSLEVMKFVHDYTWEQRKAEHEFLFRQRGVQDQVQGCYCMWYTYTNNTLQCVPDKLSYQAKCLQFTNILLFV
jgi:hypothetical protein